LSEFFSFSKLALSDCVTILSTETICSVTLKKGYGILVQMGYLGIAGVLYGPEGRENTRLL